MEPSELSVVLEEGGTWSDGGLFLFAEKDASHMGSPQTQAELSRDPEGSGGQEGELALTGEVLESRGEEAEHAQDDEGDSELDPDDLDEDVQCPREEETVQLPGSPECKSCHYRMVRTPRRFCHAQVSGSEAAPKEFGDQSGFSLLSLLFRLGALQA